MRVFSDKCNYFAELNGNGFYDNEIWDQNWWGGETDPEEIVNYLPSPLIDIEPIDEQQEDCGEGIVQNMMEGEDDETPADIYNNGINLEHTGNYSRALSTY